MKHFVIGIISAIVFSNSMAMDSYSPLTGVLNVDSIVDGGLQYNNVSVGLPGGYNYAPGATAPTPTTPYVPSTSINTQFPPPVSAANGTVCTSGPVPTGSPTNWQQNGPITPAASYLTPIADATTLNAMTLVFFRHGEEVLTAPVQSGITYPFPLSQYSQSLGLVAGYNDVGNMSSIGQVRAQQLPATLNQYFGCPNYTIAPTPSVVTQGAGQGAGGYYNYVRPLATIEPTATTLGFPVWTPYGAYPTTNNYLNINNITAYGLPYDLLTNAAFTNTSAPFTAFIAWEHNNIVSMVNYILSKGGLTASGVATVAAGTPSFFKLNGYNYQCQSLPATPPALLPSAAIWNSCDWDSIWVLQIQGGQACYLHFYENLNNTQQQNNCSNPAWPQTPVSNPVRIN
jgi:hypothetical protein